jgi:hypothetical protein
MPRPLRACGGEPVASFVITAHVGSSDEDGNEWEPTMDVTEVSPEEGEKLVKRFGG